MKIFLYINTLSKGGAERVLTVLADRFAGRGHECTLITSFVDEGEFPVSSDVRRIVLDDNTEKNRVRKNLSRISKLRSICRKGKPDVVISFLDEPNYRLLVATAFTGIKTIISVRTDPAVAYAKGLPRFLAKTLYRRADGYVFQTENARNWFSPSIREKGTVIVNPVSEKFYENNASKSDSNKIVSVGRLVSEKNFSLLLRAFAAVSEKHKEQKLIIYGSGFMRETLEKEIKELGIQDCAEMYGECRDVPAAIKDASMFVLSSNVEGLPNALMEAMVMGLPVVATDCSGGGVRTLISDGENGLIVPADDRDALVGAMERLISDKELCEKLGRAARLTGESFTTDAVLNQWLAYIGKVISR